MDFEVIEKLRKRRGLTQREFAESIDFTVTGYQKMIRNQDAKVSVLERIGKVYNVHISTFFGSEIVTKVDAVQEPGVKYDKGCEGVRRENELLRSQVDLLTSNNKALQQMVDLMQGFIKTPQATTHGKAHKK